MTVRKIFHSEQHSSKFSCWITSKSCFLLWEVSSSLSFDSGASQGFRVYGVVRRAKATITTCIGRLIFPPSKEINQNSQQISTVLNQTFPKLTIKICSAASNISIFCDCARKTDALIILGKFFLDKSKQCAISFISYLVPKLGIGIEADFRG